MPVVEIVERIDAPPERVWDLISDVHRAPEWVTVMLEVIEVSDEPLRQGSTYREKSKVGPGVSETEWRVTTFDPPTVQVHECRERTLQATLTMEVEPDETGARLTHRTEFRMMPAFRPLGWIMERLFGYRMMRRELRQTVQNAKRLLESETPQPSA